MSASGRKLKRCQGRSDNTGRKMGICDYLIHHVVGEEDAVWAGRSQSSSSTAKDFTGGGLGKYPGGRACSGRGHDAGI